MQRVRKAQCRMKVVRCFFSFAYIGTHASWSDLLATSLYCSILNVAMTLRHGVWRSRLLVFVKHAMEMEAETLSDCFSCNQYLIIIPPVSKVLRTFPLKCKRTCPVSPHVQQAVVFVACVLARVRALYRALCALWMQKPQAACSLYYTTEANDRSD